MSLAEVYELYEVWTEGIRREDTRFGILASILVNANTDPKRHVGPPAMPADFFPSLAEEYEPPSDEQLAAKLQAAFTRGD